MQSAMYAAMPIAAGDAISTSFLLSLTQHPTEGLQCGDLHLMPFLKGNRRKDRSIPKPSSPTSSQGDRLSLGSECRIWGLSLGACTEHQKRSVIMQVLLHRKVGKLWLCKLQVAKHACKDARTAGFVYLAISSTSSILQTSILLYT